MATAQYWTFQSTTHKQNKPVYIELFAPCGGQLEQHSCTWSIKRHGIFQYSSCRFFAKLSDAIPLGSPELLELHMPQQELAMEEGKGRGGGGAAPAGGSMHAASQTVKVPAGLYKAQMTCCIRCTHAYLRVKQFHESSGVHTVQTSVLDAHTDETCYCPLPSLYHCHQQTALLNHWLYCQAAPPKDGDCTLRRGCLHQI